MQHDFPVDKGTFIMLNFSVVFHFPYCDRALGPATARARVKVFLNSRYFLLLIFLVAGFTGCGDNTSGGSATTPVHTFPAELIGTWLMKGSEQDPPVPFDTTIIITDESFLLNDSDGSYFHFIISGWEAENNNATSGAANRTYYPSGYRLTGIVRIQSGYGIVPSIAVYLHRDGTSLVRKLNTSHTLDLIHHKQ